MPGFSFSAQTRDNSERALAAESAGNSFVDAYPIKMIFEFTAACNLHCFMCGFEMTRDELRAGGRTKFVLPVKTFHAIAQKVFPHISIICPTISGEPFLLPYFDEMLEQAEKYDCKFELFTNGMLLCGDKLDRLMNRLEVLSVSFDGATKETFEYVRTGANFETVLDNVENFGRKRRELGLEKDFQFNFNVTLLAENVHELPQIIEIAAANGVDSVAVGYMMVLGEETRKSSPLNCPEKTNHALAEARKTAERLGMKVSLPNPLPANAAEQIQIDAGGEDALDTPNEVVPVEVVPGVVDEVRVVTEDAASIPEEETDGDSSERYDIEKRINWGIPKEWKGKYYCNMPWRQVCIGQQGEVWPCCSPSRPLLGNGFEQDFMEIWNGPEYQRLREGLISGNLTDYCRHCPFLQEAGAVPYDSEGFVFVPES